MIAKDLQPISIVEDRGFNVFVKTLDPHYRIPSRKRMMEGTITDLFNSCKEKIKAALQCAQCGSHNRYVDFEDHRSILNCILSFH